jgi:hypothetical protein
VPKNKTLANRLPCGFTDCVVSPCNSIFSEIAKRQVSEQIHSANRVYQEIIIRDLHSTKRLSVFPPLPSITQQRSFFGSGGWRWHPPYHRRDPRAPKIAQRNVSREQPLPHKKAEKSTRSAPGAYAPST